MGHVNSVFPSRAWAWEPAEELDPLWLLRAVRLGFPRASNPDANVQTGMWAVQNKAHKYQGGDPKSACSLPPRLVVSTLRPALLFNDCK